MADEPMTLSSVVEFNVMPGLKIVTGLATGGTDYDADPGQLLDLSSYFQVIYNMQFGGATAAADALVYPTYINDDFTDADGGAVVYTWDPADGSAAEVFANVDDTTNMSGYVWRFTAIGTEVTRT
jgi:hypothetical protein